MPRKTTPREVTRRDLIRTTTLGVGAFSSLPEDRSPRSARRQPATRQATLTLDSGAFLLYEEEAAEDYSEVGSYLPDLKIFGDGELLARIDPKVFGERGSIVAVSQLDAQGLAFGRGVTLAKSFKRSLLHHDALYDGAPVRIDRQRYHCTFRFTAGHFCGAMIKTRAFKEARGVPPQYTGRRKRVKDIAHDVDVHYVLGSGESLALLLDGETLWSSADHPGVRHRFDLQVMADNATAEMFYRDALVLEPDALYWLPNQGDPPPSWSHNGPSGGG